MVLKSPPFPEEGAEMPPGPHPADDGLGCFVRRFMASDHATRAVLAAIDARLDALGIDPDDRASVELIVAEVLNNIGEHAYGGKAGPVELVIEIDRTGLVCRLSDRGVPLPGGVMAANGPPPIQPPENLPEGGFGWHIIRCLASELRYWRQDGWNRLSFRVGLSGFD